MLKLPKWLQDKFREHLKRLQRQRAIMPTIKKVVEFLNDRAGLANHPIFTSTLTEVKSFKQNDLRHLGSLFFLFF